MSDIIRLKRSGVTGAAPTSLELGELALNYADGTLYYKTSAGSITTLGGADPRWSYLLPAAPTSVSATSGDAQATVTWTAPTSVAAITDYVVQYSSNSGSTWTTFSDGTSTSTSATVTGLTNGTAYVFRVAAVSGIGQGPYSAVPAAGDPYWPSVALLLHMDGSGSTIVDSSGTPKTITAVGGATQSATQSKWGGKSLALDGDGDNITVPSTGLDLGSGDFAIEAWIYLTSIDGYAPLIEARSSAAYQNYICGIYNVDGTLRPDFVNSGGAGTRLTGTSTSISLNTWTHIAFVRVSGIIYAYVNGTRDATNANYSSSISASTSPLLIGRNVDGAFVSGYIDDLRVTIGSSRGYAGATISVPTAAFPDGPDPSVTPTNITYVAIPTMTSATAPSGVVSDSGVLSAGTPSWSAFDKETVSGDTTFYGSPSPASGNWIQYDFGYVTRAGGYQITSRQLDPYGSSQAPPSWTLSGSLNGTEFTTIDTRTSQTWAGPGEMKSFALASHADYRYWRWTWTDNPAAGAAVLPKIQLTAPA